MRKTRAISAIFLFSAIHCLTAVLLGQSHLDPNTLGRIDGMMEGWIAEKKFPGGAVLISQGDQIRKFSTYGTIDGVDTALDADTLYRFYSMTKPVTVAAALILYEQGAFLLDDPIDQLWPEMKKLRVYVSGEGDSMVTKVPDAYPTVRDLMMHTSGFFYAYSDHPAHRALMEIELSEADVSISDVALKIAEVPLLFEPGERWNYGLSQDVLAGLVEYLSGQRFGSFLSNEIFEPLGMDSFGHLSQIVDTASLMTLYTLSEDGEFVEMGSDERWIADPRIEWGGSGLIGTAEDYWRFARMLMQGGELEGKRILSSASVHYMLSNHLTDSQIPYEAPGSPYERFAKGFGFGLGVKVMMNPNLSGNLSSVGESGWSGAASTHFWMIPEHDIVVIFLTQNRAFLEIQPLAEMVKVAVYQSLID
ncbi:MAG: serine hydrolase domain-containing protein [Verrucomicrobiota bacterium]